MDLFPKELDNIKIKLLKLIVWSDHFFHGGLDYLNRFRNLKMIDLKLEFDPRVGKYFGCGDFYEIQRSIEELKFAKVRFTVDTYKSELRDAVKMMRRLNE